MDEHNSIHVGWEILCIGVVERHVTPGTRHTSGEILRMELLGEETRQALYTVARHDLGCAVGVVEHLITHLAT